MRPTARITVSLSIRTVLPCVRTKRGDVGPWDTPVMARSGLRARRAQVARVSLDEPLGPIEVASRYTDVLLVVSAEGAVLGEIVVPAQRVVSVELQETVSADRLMERLWRRRLASRFLRAARGDTPLPADDVGDV